ncbi:MAG: ATP-binding cassette domain-containing protein [Anaerolineae bacterium]
MIHTSNLTRWFGETLAVHDLSLSIEEGEVFGLLGPNGAGKTTTVRVLAALIAPTSGAARVASYQLGTEDMDVRRRVGILTESPGLYDRLSAEQNLRFYAELYEVPVDRQPAQIERYLQLLGLWERRNEPVGGFSKGMRQKLAIARALLHEPPVLFLDEPTAGLDPQAARTVRDFIEELRTEGRTTLLTTHNLDEAERLCDRIGVLNTRLVAVDTPENLRRRLFGRQTVVQLSQLEPRFVQLVERLPFVRQVQLQDNRLVIDVPEPDEQNPLIVRQLVESGGQVQYVTELEHSLEDVYFSLVDSEQ